MFKSLTAIPTESSHLFRIIGDSREMEKLKKALTVINKSVAFQVKQAEEKLKFWRIRKAAEEKANGSASDYVLNKINECVAAIDLGKDNLKEEYFQESNGELFIPSGFWYMVGKVEGEAHLNTEIEPYLIPGLRDYQQEIVKELLKYKRATGVLATGLGKTFVIASLTLSAIKSGKRVIIAVPTEYLVGQVYDTLIKFHDSVTAAGGGRKPKLGQDVLVTTAQSAIKYTDTYPVVIIDESHREAAKTWQDFITESDNVECVYNLTATAFRADGLDLGIHALGGPVVYERGARWAIENKWLKPLSVFLANISAKKNDGSCVNVSPKAHSSTAYKILTKNYEVLFFIKQFAERALSRKRKVIILFKTVTAGLEFKKICGNMNFDVASSKYKKPLYDFKDGKTNILVSNDKLISEGIDVQADCLINVIQNSSPVTTFQSVGRILRPGYGENAIVIDICIDNYDMFKKSQKKREKSYLKLTDNVTGILK